jgi:hypothetical protein
VVNTVDCSPDGLRIITTAREALELTGEEHFDWQGRRNEFLLVVVRLYLAMARQDLKQEALAKKWLTQATQRLDRKPPTEWYDRVLLQALRREAEALILAPQP